MLFLVTTPIGNLKDITLRALEVLKDADLILCEDTRHSQKLLLHFNIHKPLESYHKFNETEKAAKVVELLRNGKNICLISDAGTPLISDPGSPLVTECIKAGIEVTAVGAPCALIHAMICSGMEAERFQFLGFLPKKEKELTELFNQVSSYQGVSIAYESPNRILKTLELLSEIKPNMRLCLAKELTKKFEKFFRGTPKELIQILKDHSIKGEWVLLAEGQEEAPDFSAMSVETHVDKVMETYGVAKGEAIKIVADLRGINKRALYQALHKT